MKIKRSEINRLVEQEVSKRIKMINEDGEGVESGGFCPGGAYFTGGGGAYGPFQTLANTIGIGNPVPAGSDGLAGSGDKFDNIVTKPVKKKGADEK
jgi:hypothetical protein